jgi:ligand-binding sensor domain-containing protein/signal transduction histidine kinase/DNA-binding response OmpR family regulator
MVRGQIFFILRLFLFLLPIGSLGQKIRFYNSEQGLPISQIHKVTQDSRGYIWIATENGLSYFDGIRFTTFYYDPDKPGSIADNLTKVIFTDSKGTCWLGSAKGLQTFSYETNTFIDFPIQSPDFNGPVYISSIVENKLLGKLIVSNSGYGLMVYNTDDYKINNEATKILNELSETNFPGNLLFDSQDFLWAYSEQGNFSKINMQTYKTTPLLWQPELNELSKKIIVSALAEDPLTQNILIGTYNHGIFIYDKLTGYIRKPKGRKPIDLRIRALLAEKSDFDGNSEIWVGTEDSGLKKLDRNTEEIINPDFQYAPINLENCKVHSIMQDAQGNIWAGIFQKGLIVIPKSSKNFQYIKLSDTQGSMSMNIACVNSIVRDNLSNLWVGTDGGGLFRIASDGIKTHFTKDNTPLPNNAILSLTADSRGTLWISTYMGGITTYNPKTGFLSYSNDIELQKVSNMLYDKKNDNLYLGTLGRGVKVLSLNNHKLETFPRPGINGWASSLCHDESDNLWVGLTGGLRCYNTITGEEQYLEVTNKFNGISITTSLEDKDGSMWFGSSKGLFHFKKGSNDLETYTNSDGLPSNLVCAIQQDMKGILWLSTINGLSEFDPKTGLFKNYYASDGLQDNEFRNRASFKDNDGRLFFGGINGISTFYPDRITNENKLFSKLYFSRLTVLNHPVNYDDALGKKNILDRHISQAHQITLKKEQNVFAIEFSVLEYTNPQKVIYGYMLKGFDTDWRYTSSNNRQATYTNLPEGSYVFRVKAFFEGYSDDQNVVNNEINIRILPPWYKTWWAYIIYVFFFLLAIWAFHNFLLYRKLRKQELLELEMKEMKLRMFTDLTHEIRTPFTLVMSPLESMREAETDQKRKDMYNLMYRNILRILRLLNQLMDMRKIDNHQLKMHYQKTDLIFFINDIIQSFEQLAIVRNIDFRLVSNFESIEIWIDQANFDKVIYNILSNAFKFSPDNGYIMISVNILKNNQHVGLRNNISDYVELCIENSGSKIDEKELERIFDRFYQSENNIIRGSGIGLHLAKMIIKLHQGNIHAKNVDNGVNFIVRIPLGKKHISNDQIVYSDKADLYSNSIKTGQPKESDYIEIPQNEDNSGVFANAKLKYRIIFVDDEEDIGKYMRLELSDKYNVEVYSDAAAAWKVISTTIPDVVISDLIMEDIDGMALCRKIRQNPDTNHLPVIILTSQTDKESEKRCIEIGADHYLTKPINIELLKSAISQVIHTRETIKNKYRSDVNLDFDKIKISSPDSRLITNVIEAIRKNIENPDFSVDDLSKEVGLSRVHLNRKLKENINISPNNLIRSIRLKQAAYLLINNKVNIADVAYNVGFSSPSYFSNNFKEYFGMAPTEFVMKYIDSHEKDSFNKLFEN